MPIKRFWLFSECIDRLQASDDLRAIRVVSATSSKEASDSTIPKLVESVGTVVIKDYARDPRATERLRAMMKR